MDGDCDSNSWQDRCDRYFTSISDTGKDRDQEKYSFNHGELAREKHDPKNRLTEDDDKLWRDLSEVRNRFSEHWLLRRARKILSELDIHGARKAVRSKGRVGFIFWLIIICIAVVAFSSLLYYMCKEMWNRPSFYQVNRMESMRKETGKFSVTVCNFNLIKKSKLQTSSLTELKNMIIDNMVYQSRTDNVTVRDAINANTKLKEFLTETIPYAFSDFVTTIEDDVVVQELTKASNESLLYRVSRYGRANLMKEIAQISIADIQEMGYTTREMLVQCWKDNVQCSAGDVQTQTSTVYGNCIRVSIPRSSSTLELVLDVRSAEYIELLSPAVGFIISMYDHSADIMQGQLMKISPGLHYTVSVNKVTTIMRLDKTCSSSNVQKQTCHGRCLDDQVKKLCGCVVGEETHNSRMCKMNRPFDHICVKSLQHLSLERNLPCQCQEMCREKVYDLGMRAIVWPSAQYTRDYGRIIIPTYAEVTDTYLRDNMALLTIHPTPALYEDIGEYEPNKIMDILISIGALSAVCVGASVVTLLELLYMLIQCGVRTISCIRKRSDNAASPRRLSDSDITSITWAMYRQRRRLEETNKHEINKPADKGAFEGNVHTRISKRNSYLDPENRETNYEVNHEYMTSNHRVTGSGDIPAQNNGYIRRYDGKKPAYQSRYRENSAKAGNEYSNTNTGDINGTYHDNDYKVSVIRTQHQYDYKYDNHLEHPNMKDSGSTGNDARHNRPRYSDKNSSERNSQENVLFYNGSSAYFSSGNVSEPVYL